MNQQPPVNQHPPVDQHGGRRTRPARARDARRVPAGQRRLLRLGGAGLTITALIGGLAACSAPEPAAPEPKPSYVSSWQPAAATEIAPLRGTTVPAESLTAASVAAKIDNHPAARPQFGLERTDIVFEELVEGGMTRYVAVWHSDVPEILGPVRSIRPMDPDIAGPFGIIFYSGGQPRFMDMMRSTPVYNAIHGQPDTADFMYRGERAAPHNVLVKARDFVAAHSDITAPAQQFAFSLDVASSTAAKEGSPTGAVNLVFSPQTRQHWTWDAGQLVFLRHQGGAPDLDGNGAQLAATNVVTLRVPVTHGYGVPKTELIGSGEAWVSTGGATVHATWHKDGATAPIRLVDGQGLTVRLAAGNTWVELVPNDGAVEIVAPAG